MYNININNYFHSSGILLFKLKFQDILTNVAGSASSQVRMNFQRRSVTKNKIKQFKMKDTKKHRLVTMTQIIK
uniref:Uncharacterized protein n=1 Tax=Anguilla anguilla TaxID=7936 RepID=A0A0E9UWR0_ANGAN